MLWFVSKLHLLLLSRSLVPPPCKLVHLYTHIHTGICDQNLKGVQKEQFACLVGILNKREFQRCVSMEFGAVSVVLIGYFHGHQLKDK